MTWKHTIEDLKRLFYLNRKKFITKLQTYCLNLRASQSYDKVMEIIVDQSIFKII